MSRLPDVENWLKDAGYEYHCFISWPRTKSWAVTACAKCLKESIEENLADTVPDPKVFLDESSVAGGAKWERVITQALCKSIVLIAVCAPIYYHETHRWCGLEWAGMYNLSKKRLPNEDFHTIIPIIVRGRESLPEPVAKIQHFDFSKLTITGQSFFETPEYLEKIEEIRQRIENVAIAISKNGVAADCEDFELPSESAFSDHQVKKQPPPL